MRLFKRKKEKKEFVVELTYKIHWKYKGTLWESEKSKKLDRPILLEKFNIDDFKRSIKDDVLKTKGKDYLIEGNAYIRNFNFKNIEYFWVELKKKDLTTLEK